MEQQLERINNFQEYLRISGGFFIGTGLAEYIINIFINSKSDIKSSSKTFKKWRDTMLKKTLFINGSGQRIVADPEATLASVLRNQLFLTGTKVGCGKGVCGRLYGHSGRKGGKVLFR